MKEVIFYSIGCPRCNILQKKLEQKNVKYTLCDDIPLMEEKGFTYLPMLEIDGKIYEYKEAVAFLNSLS